MPTPHFHNPGPPLTDPALRAAEHRLGITLPPIYRRFLLDHNGGQPAPSWFDISDHFEGADRVDTLLSLNHSDHNRNLETAAHDYSDYFRGGLLPIGFTWFSGILAADLRIPGREPIVYLDVADPLDDHGMKRTYPVGDDVMEFCSRLRNDAT